MSNFQDIWQAVANGDQLAFRKLYDEYSQLVYNTALGFCHHQQSAEDITQEVFTKIFRNVGSFNGRSAIKTWIYRITVNTALNHIERSKRKRFDDLTNVTQADNEHPGILLEKREDAKWLFAAIDTLKGNQKAAFVLSFVEEMPRQEVADVLELSLKSVESLLQRAKKNMRNQLATMYPNRRKK